jgi:hypothetical protein
MVIVVDKLRRWMWCWEYNLEREFKEGAGRNVLGSEWPAKHGYLLGSVPVTTVDGRVWVFEDLIERVATEQSHRVYFFHCLVHVSISSE